MDSTDTSYNPFDTSGLFDTTGTGATTPSTDGTSAPSSSGWFSTDNLLTTLNGLANLGTSINNSVNGTSTPQPNPSTARRQPATTVGSGFMSFFTSTTGILMAVGGIVILGFMLLRGRRAR